MDSLSKQVYWDGWVEPFNFMTNVMIQIIGLSAPIIIVLLALFGILYTLLKIGSNK